MATNALADPPLSDSVAVVITVDDVNEFAPSFTPSTPERVYVPEYSHPQNTPVLYLFADDDDCVSCLQSITIFSVDHWLIFNYNYADPFKIVMLSMIFVSLQSTDVDFSFSLLTRIANSPFSLDQNNGQLFLTGILDYEERNSYTVSSCMRVSMYVCLYIHACMYH